VEVVASLSQGRTAAAQCGLFTYKSVPVIFEPHCMLYLSAVITCRTGVSGRTKFVFWKIYNQSVVKKVRFHGECVFLREIIVLYPLQVSLLLQLKQLHLPKTKLFILC